jgi:hypothetical protein
MAACLRGDVTTPKWLGWAQKLQAMRERIAYARDPFDVEPCTKMATTAKFCRTDGGELFDAAVRKLRCARSLQAMQGHATPCFSYAAS